MGTFASQEPDVGELRFIARLLKTSLPNGIPQSDIQGGSAIEGSDVFLVNGQTRSKFYSSVSDLLPLSMFSSSCLHRSVSLKIKFTE